MAAPGFWDDPDSARSAVDDMRQLKRWTEPFANLTRRVQDARELADLLTGAIDRKVRWSSELPNGKAADPSTLQVISVRVGENPGAHSAWGYCVPLHSRVDLRRGTVFASWRAGILAPSSPPRVTAARNTRWRREPACALRVPAVNETIGDAEPWRLRTA